MSPVGDDTEGGFYRESDGKFVASWFHVVAVTKDAWLVAYLPTDCRRIAASLVPFAEAKRLPAVLRKAGCRVGSAKLLVEMMKGFVLKFSN